ncbi:MAG: helix-hairpin-helix domain-containing protein, partial [Caldilineaceae bacterium]
VNQHTLLIAPDSMPAATMNAHAPQPTAQPDVSGVRPAPPGAATAAPDRMPGFWPGALLGLLCGALVAGGIALWIGQSKPPPIVVQPPPAAAPVAQPSPVPMTVHVSGAVAQPGLYVLPGDGRVADALAAAGGILPAADAAPLNLARRLSDGARLHVPLVGEVVAPELALPNDQALSGEGATRGSALDLRGVPIDLNTATLEELLALPGVGEKTAAAIVAARPFATVDALDTVPGIGPVTLEELRPLVTVP